MNIITAINRLKNKIEPKPENGFKSKPFYPNSEDFKAINLIMEFVEKSLIDNQNHKDIRVQKLYLILFTIFLKEYECPITAESMVANLYNKTINYNVFKIKSLLDMIFIENLENESELKEMENENQEIIKNIKLHMNNLFTLNKNE